MLATFVREKYFESAINIKYVDRYLQILDIMAKLLARVRFELLRDMLRVVKYSYNISKM